MKPLLARIGFCLAAGFLVAIPVYFAWPALTAPPLAGGVSADEPLPFCGNGKIEPTELCDDGNHVDGDGCTGCLIDARFTCAGEPSRCVRSTRGGCGNGVLNVGEACDDGNIVDGDGCSARCQIQRGYVCEQPGKYCRRAYD